VLLVVLLTFGPLAVLSYRTFRDVRYPPFIICSLWLAVLCLYYSAPLEIDSISVLTFLIFLSMALAFTGGARVVVDLFGEPSIVRRHSFKDLGSVGSLARHPRVRRLLVGMTAILLPFATMRAFEIVSQSGYKVFFIGLRTEVLAEDSAGYGALGFASIVSFFTTFLYATELRGDKREKVWFYFSVFVSIAYAVLSTGRTTVFFILAVLLGIGSIRGRLRIRALLVSATVFLMFFVFFALATFKGADPSASWGDNALSIGESLLTYAEGPIPAFDRVVTESTPLSWGTRTFVGPLNIVRRLRGRARVSPIQEEVDVPFPVNVYTGIQPVYRDFGVVGVVLGFGLIGAAMTYSYLRALSGDKLHTFYYGLMLFPILFSTFSDQFFAPMVAWFLYGSAGYLYFRVGGGKVRLV
jgi:oligosaccharide repeat unit polymerase